jgi:hypothetical protein
MRVKPRKKRPTKKRAAANVPQGSQLPPEPVSPARADWQEPTDGQRRRAYDVERDGVQEEVGPDEADVDERLRH